MLLEAMPDMIGMLGMNQEGLVFIGTTVSSRQVSYGLPKPFICRSILRNCNNVKEATEALLDFPRTTGGNALLVDASGDLRIAECSSVKCAVIYPEKGYVAVTNHYADDDLFGLSLPDIASSQARLRRIKWLLEHAEKLDLEEMFSFTRDHEHTPDSFTISQALGKNFFRIQLGRQ
jgi:predicted choloylglycine hydrolase